MNNIIKLNQYAPRCLTNREKKIVMYWSPKAGCSTLAKIFFSYIGVEYDKTNPIITRDNYCYGLRSSVEDRKYWCNQELCFYDDCFKLQLVRNPYTRAVASFLKFLNLSADKISMSFQIYLETIISANSLVESAFIEHHMVPQYMIDTKNLNYILKLENLQEDIDILYSKYNISLVYQQDKEESYTKYRNTNINYNVSNLLYRYIKEPHNSFYAAQNKTFGIPEYYYFYNKYCKKMVEQIYGEDIEIFEYCFPYNLNIL